MPEADFLFRPIVFMNYSSGATATPARYLEMLDPRPVPLLISIPIPAQATVLALVGIFSEVALNDVR